MSKIKKWNIKELPTEAIEQIKSISKELNITEVTARLLYNRGLQNSEDAKKFLQFENEIFYSPFLLTDIDKACDRILKALENNERIVIYGDYDVDGVTSVSSLYLYLRDNGGNVGYYIPNRIGEGYGVNSTALEKLAEDKTDLLITVDTGITAVEETEYAKSIGMDVIITDHHECHDVLPDAVAVINPRRQGCNYPFKELAGVGVAFKLITALEYRIREKDGRDTEGYLKYICDKYIDLTALGTVADVMPLIDENRLIVKIGLNNIDRFKRPGLSALLEEASGSGTKKSDKSRKKASSTLISYVLAPRINAAGRISRASKAVELFLAESQKEAHEIACELCEANRERQAEENKIIEETFSKIDEGYDFENDPIIVLSSDNWHHGVIGIVSSRITEHYNRPSILISFDGDIGKGSGRSIQGLNLVNALMSCDDLLIKFGGHELAAGLSIERKNMPEFRRRINEYAKEHLKKEYLITSIDVDCELSTKDVTLRQAAELDLLEPYGISNPVPLFVMHDVTILEETPIGANKHVKLLLEKDGVKFNAVYFGMPVSELAFCAGDSIDMVFNLNVNTFNGISSEQLVIRDMDFSESKRKELAFLTSTYESLKNGNFEAFDSQIDEYVPQRGNFANVYRFLRRELRFGSDTMCIGRLISNVNSGVQDINSNKLNYVNTMLIIDILCELGLLEAEAVSEQANVPADFCRGFIYDKYKFKLINTEQKVNLDRSCIYKQLKNLMNSLKTK